MKKLSLLAAMVIFLSIFAIEANAAVPGNEELRQIAFDGLKENPGGWFYSNVDRIVRVTELKLPATPQTEIVDDKLYFNVELTYQQVNSSAKRLELRHDRFRLQCRNANGKWIMARAESKGERELIEFISMEKDAMAALPNLSNTPLDNLMGPAIALEAPKPTENPLEQFSSRIAAITSAGNDADAAVAKVKEQLVKFVRAFEGARPDWTVTSAAHAALSSLYEEDNAAFKADPRRAELKSIWEGVVAASNERSAAEVALYRDRNSDRRKELERSIREVYNNISFLRATSRYEDAMKKLEPVVAEVAYVLSLAPGWATTTWRTAQVQPQEAKLSEVLATGNAGLEEARAGYLKANESAMQNQLSMLRQAHDAGYLDGVAALEKARKMPDGTPSDASSRMSTYETAENYIGSFRNMLKTALGRYPLLKDRELAGKKISELFELATNQRLEAQDGIDALAIRVRDDARAEYQAWVASLRGDKKRIYESAGGPSERRGDIWYYRVSTGGWYTTTVYTFSGDNLISTRSVPWRE